MGLSATAEAVMMLVSAMLVFAIIHAIIAISACRSDPPQGKRLWMLSFATLPLQCHDTGKAPDLPVQTLDTCTCPMHIQAHTVLFDR